MFWSLFLAFWRFASIFGEKINTHENCTMKYPLFPTKPVYEPPCQVDLKPCIDCYMQYLWMYFSQSPHVALKD
jgi:hypothetical protein